MFLLLINVSNESCISNDLSGALPCPPIKSFKIKINNKLNEWSKSKNREIHC